MKAKLLFLLALCFFATSVAFGQKRVVKGTVLSASDGEPMIGVSVVEKGTTNGAITDVDGNFSISLPEGGVLVVSYVGYNSQMVKPVGNAPVKISLVEDSQLLDDVVVVGYGVQKKKLVTGATVQVKGDEIAKLNTTNALGAMASSTPGVQITQSSAQPGKGFKVYIRGIGTTGDASPLYVIDGVAGGNLDNINPNDIESIDVLKDAASAAIYGARAANGVILVTTKQGKAGKVELTYNGSIGWSNAYKRPQLLNAKQYMTIIDEYTFVNKGQKYNWAANIPSEILDRVNNGWEGTDWWGAFENENAMQKNHSFTLTGGTDKSKFAMSYGFTGNEGIMGGDMASYYNRHSFRINSDHVLLKVKDYDAITIGENISVNYSKNHDLAEDGMYWSYIHNLLQATPLLPQYAEDGSIYNYNDNKAGWTAAFFNNPWENLVHGGYGALAQSRSLGINATAHITIQPIKGLKWRTQYNVSWSAGTYRGYEEPRSPSEGAGIVTTYSANQSSWIGSNYSIENTLSYDFKINDHKVTVLAGQSFQGSDWGVNLAASNKVKNGDQMSTLKGWKSAYLSNFKMDAITDVSATGTPYDDNYLASWFGRINYDFKETYMATFTMRTDGSSVFADGHRWGTFPSASAGWVLTNEDFLESTKDYMDFFKLRASWGQNGNCNIPAYQYLATIKYSTANGDNGYKFGSSTEASTAGTPNTGAYANIVPNPELTWETSEQLDLGFDARFLDSRLGVNFDWYKKTTKDWLIVGPHIAIQGTDPAYINGGDVENKGVEISLSWNDKIGNDFHYNVGVNFATNKNKVTRIANDNHYVNGASGILSQGTEFLYRAEEGKPIGYFYGMSYSGIWQNQAQIDAANAESIARHPELGADFKGTWADAQPGDCRWDDYNGDGVITYDQGDNCDRHEIGNPNPDVTLGVNIGCTWKGLDFSINGAGAFGMQIMRSYRSYGDADYQNYDTRILKRWHGEGTSNSQPRLCDNGSNNTMWNSQRYMEDADYFKIKAVTLGYDFKQAFKKLPFQQLRLYVQASNLYTFTGYTGLDPEVGSSGGAESWASGIDLGLYPTSRTWTVGATVKF